MKVFKLANAELGKLLLRPAIYVMTAFLVLALVITSFTFSPQKKEANLTTFGSKASDTVNVAFSDFNNQLKTPLDTKLTDTNKLIVEFTTENGVYEALITKIEDVNSILTGSTGTSLPITETAYKTSETTENETALKGSLLEVRNKALLVYNHCHSTITPNNINFYATSAQIQQIEDYFRKLAITIPNNFESTQQLKDVASQIRRNYESDVAIQLAKINNYTKISVDTIKITNDYFEPIKYQEDSNTLLTTLYKDIEYFANNHLSSNTEEDKLEFNKLTTKYKNACNISINLLENSFALAKSGNYSNTEIIKYKGFEGYNTYSINENLTLNKYLLENKIFDGDYLLNFNYNSISGDTASAYDFTFYSMQILGIIITIFCLFFAVSITSGEFQNGTIKMVASRPFTREKLISGKVFACILLMSIFIIFSAIASFVVGIAQYGLDLQTVLLVFNATSVIALPDCVVMLIYLASLGINILFYITIAFLLSIIFRSSTFALFGTFVIYFFGLLFNAISSTASWFLYTPYAHLDLFKYFGNSFSNGGFLSMNLPIGGAIITSALVVFITMIVLDFTTKIIFRKRDIA